jgi:hypothetical protein
MGSVKKLSPLSIFEINLRFISEMKASNVFRGWSWLLFINFDSAWFWKHMKYPLIFQYLELKKKFDEKILSFCFYRIFEPSQAFWCWIWITDCKRKKNNDISRGLNTNFFQLKFRKLKYFFFQFIESYILKLSSQNYSLIRIL